MWWLCLVSNFAWWFTKQQEWKGGFPWEEIKGSSAFPTIDKKQEIFFQKLQSYWQDIHLKISMRKEWTKLGHLKEFIDNWNANPGIFFYFVLENYSTDFIRFFFFFFYMSCRCTKSLCYFVIYYWRCISGLAYRGAGKCLGAPLLLDALGTFFFFLSLFNNCILARQIYEKAPAFRKGHWNI